MRERFPRRNDSNLRHPHDNRNDKSQRDYSGPSRKHKPDDLIVAVDRPSRGKKSTMQEEFEKLPQKKCPWHPSANHAAIDCYHLRRTFSNSGAGKKNKKPVDKEPEDNDQGDQGCNVKFQDASKTVNVIFGGDGDFGSRREQKLLLREIMSVEPGHYDHSAGQRCPSCSPTMISGQAFQSLVSSPWSWTRWWQKSGSPRCSLTVGVVSTSSSPAL
jgi:hypothetical protein